MKHWINTGITILVVSLISILFYDQWFFPILLSLVIFIYLVFLSLGILFMQFNYFLKAKTRLNNNLCLLTFDDGPHEERTIKVLETLKQFNVKALFFLVGEKAERHPEIVERIRNEGHLIGNHSYSHNKFMSMFTRNKLRKDIDMAQKVIKNIIGEDVSLFRPPIGYTNPNYATVLKERSMKCIGWTLRSYDSVYKEPNQLVKRLVVKSKPGNIVLLHDNLQVTSEALSSYIEQAISNGIIFASEDTIQSVFDE